MDSSLADLMASAGWNDSSVLALLWEFVRARHTDEEVLEYFRKVAQAERRDGT